MTLGSLFDGKKILSDETRMRMSESAKNRCTEEWRKRQSEQKATRLPIDEVKSMYESGMSQLEIADHFNTSQKVIWRFFKNNGIKSRSKARRNQLGENNPIWKGGYTICEHGYMNIKTPGHPRASQCGEYVPEHILVMEKHIGRYLKWFGPNHPETEIVHHLNENKLDNRIENLELTTYAKHMRIHNQLRKQKQPNIRKSF